MKKITTLLMLLIIAISGSAKSTAYAPDARVGAGELLTGRNYMIFNTAYTPGSYSNRWGAIYYNATSSAIRTYGGAVPENFITEDQNYLFQLPLNEPNSLYCIGSAKLIGDNFTFTPWEEATSGKGGAQSRNDDGSFTANADISAANKVWLIHNGSQYWNGNNWNNVGDNSFATWTDGHPYAIYTVKEVVTVTVTYRLCEVDGFELWEEDVEQAANSPVNVPASMQGGNLYSISTEGTIGEEDCEIIVTRTPNFTFDASVNFGNLKVKNDATTTETSAITEGQWYMLTQVRGTETPVYDTGAGNTLKRTSSAVSITQGTDPDDVAQYLVRFFNTGTGDAKYIQFATGNFWNDMKSSASNATMFLVYPARNNSYNYDGWAMNATTDGTTYGSIVDNNGNGNTLAYWSSGQVTTGNNNVWKLYPVDLVDPTVTTTVTLTYQINDSQGNVIVENAGTVTGYVGEALPEVPTDYRNDFVTYTYNYSVVPRQDATVVATATYNLPFELSEDPTDFNNANWYLLTLREKFCTPYLAEDDEPILGNIGFYFSFGGNPVTGISVYSQFEEKYLYVGSSADNSLAEYSSNPFYFTIKKNDNQTNGFNLNVPGTNAYINLRDGKISTWLNAAANGEVGSCLVAMTETEYLINKIKTLYPYFQNYGMVGTMAFDAQTHRSLYQMYLTLLNAPSLEGYEALKAVIHSNAIQLESGKYYTIRSAYSNFEAQQGETKTMRYNPSTGTITWGTEGDAPEYEVFQVRSISTGNVLYNPMGEVYLNNVNGSVTTDSLDAETFRIDSVGIGQFNIFLARWAAPLHANGHGSGAGVSGSLTNWAGGANTASAWHIIPQDITEIELIAPEGVADGEEVVQSFAHTEDGQLPPSAGLFTISEELNTGARLDTVTSRRLAERVGYIVSGKKGARIPVLPILRTPTTVVEVPAGNLLVPGDSTNINGGFIIAYKKGDRLAKFWTINNLTVPRNRAYLPAGTTTRGLERIFGGLGDIEDVTAIKDVNTGSENENANAPIYDLQGRRVSKVQKGGVYIIGGKKVIK